MEKSYVINIEYEADPKDIEKIEDFAMYKLEAIDTECFSGNAAFCPHVRLESPSERAVDEAAAELLAYCKRFSSFKEAI